MIWVIGIRTLSRAQLHEHSIGPDTNTSICINASLKIHRGTHASILTLTLLEWVYILPRMLNSEEKGRKGDQQKDTINLKTTFWVRDRRDAK